MCIDELRIAICLKHAVIQTILLENEQSVDPPKMIGHIQRIDMSDWKLIPDNKWSIYFQSKMEQLLAKLNSDDIRLYNFEMELLAQRLKVSENIVKQQRLLRETFVGRKWLASRVQEWFEDDSAPSMIIFGVPGAGKSAFSANLANYNPAVFATLMLEWGRSFSTDADMSVRLLAYKLASTLSDYRRMLLNRLSDEKTTDNLLKENHGDALFDALISDLLYCCVDSDRRQCGMIIIDGLDEAELRVAKMLYNKACQLPTWIKTLFTSRYDETTASFFSDSQVIRLNSASEDNYADLKEYFVYRLCLSDEDPVIEQLAEKCEGSFMYAKALGEAIADRTFNIYDIKRFPSGMNNFYYNFFDRYFSSRSDFIAIRPFLELLTVEEDIPEIVLCQCLNVDKYELWELRHKMNSFIVTGKSNDISQSFFEYKTIRFVHKTVSDWLTDPKLSGEFWVDSKKGYSRLADLGKKVYGNIEESPIDDKNYVSMCVNEYPKWLVKSGRYEEYVRMLLSSFDKSEMEKRIPELYNCYNYYYHFYRIWKYVDLLPKEYCVDSLVEKLTEIVTFPRSYMVSRFSHRSFQISALLLSFCMESGRFNSVFISFMQQISYDAYFRSRASDDGETQDGWDKYYMTRDVVKCLKKCDTIKYPVPDEVRRRCERMKLCYLYYNGDPDGGCGHDTLEDDELLKDVCVLDDENNQALRLRRSIYNTNCLKRYLSVGEDEDFDYVRKCTDNYAVLGKACQEAVAAIEKRSRSLESTKKAQGRISFIKAVMNQYEAGAQKLQ